MNVCVLPGDGIGPEVTDAAVRVLDSMDLGLHFVYGEIGLAAHTELGSALPPETLEKVLASQATLLGAVTTPPGLPDYRSPVIELRQRLDLHANLRPVISMPHERSREDIDLVIVRENTEGLYAGVERVDESRSAAIAERLVTRTASERIVRLAFELAQNRDSKRRVTLVHKANILRVTCGLFRDVALEIASAFPDITTEEMLVDACAMNLVQRPEHFDVIVTTNLFGDILSDEAAALTGGLGLAASANIGLQRAIFEPVHGSAPDIAGTALANPMAAILAGAMLLDYLQVQEAGDAIRKAVRKAMADGRVTPDLGGCLSTSDVRDAVIGNLA